MKKWSVGIPDRNTVLKLMTGCSVTSLTASAIASKGYESPDSVIKSLNVGELSDLERPQIVLASDRPGGVDRDHGEELSCGEKEGVVRDRLLRRSYGYRYSLLVSA